MLLDHIVASAGRDVVTIRPDRRTRVIGEKRAQEFVAIIRTQRVRTRADRIADRIRPLLLRRTLTSLSALPTLLRRLFELARRHKERSGWAWLIPGKDKPLAIVPAANQDNPVIAGLPAPILGLDVWEHAYYLKYQNKRADYIAAWFKVVNWDQAAANYAEAKKG